jgi:hypothetical protein
MNFDEPQPLSGGHIDIPAAVCQYGNCTNLICADCARRCDECGDMLCRDHQERVDGGDRVICQDHLTRHAAMKLVNTVLGRR